jgi:hypothetical protein
VKGFVDFSLLISILASSTANHSLKSKVHLLETVRYLFMPRSQENLFEDFLQSTKVPHCQGIRPFLDQTLREVQRLQLEFIFDVLRKKFQWRVSAEALKLCILCGQSYNFRKDCSDLCNTEAYYCPDYCIASLKCVRLHI